MKYVYLCVLTLAFGCTYDMGPCDGGTTVTTGAITTAASTTASASSSGTTTVGATSGASIGTTTAYCPTTGSHVAGSTSTVSSSTSGASTSGGSTGGPPAPGKEVWGWVYENYSVSLNTMAASPNSFTHVSPTFYTLNYPYTSGVAWYSNCPNGNLGGYLCADAGTNNFSGLTTEEFTTQAVSDGFKVVPAIYAGAGNGGTDEAVASILNNTNGAQTAFIKAMTQEALANGYAGYNLDWELGSVVNNTYTQLFVTFVNNFKAALAPSGMTLSVDAIVSNIDGTWCSGDDGYLDFNLLAKSSIDRIMIEAYTPDLGPTTTSCQKAILNNTSPLACPLNTIGSYTTFTGDMNLMCSNLPVSMIVMGIETYSNTNNLIAGSLITSMEAYGLNKIAIWPQLEEPYPYLSDNDIAPSNETWYGLLSQFLVQ